MFVTIIGRCQNQAFHRRLALAATEQLDPSRTVKWAGRVPEELRRPFVDYLVGDVRTNSRWRWPRQAAIHHG